jgi:hypothetical protein
MIHIFVQLQDVLKPQQMKTLYYALVHSVMSYGILAWGGAAITILDPLINTQKILIKVLFRFNYLYPSIDLYRNSDILSVRQASPPGSIARITRNMNNIPVPLPCVSFFKRTHLFRGPRLWNELFGVGKAFGGTAFSKKVVSMYMVHRNLQL